MKNGKKFARFKFHPVTIDNLKFKQIDYHRNGVSGEGFYCAVAFDKEQKADMLITYFPEEVGCCAVYQLDLLPDITFGKNSWRGDVYLPVMKKAIHQYTLQYDEFYKEKR
jgi:hypothetical protein